ncbi:MAG: single-stranded-DNA-specific exonuclease RecJ [Christensenellales bacterium]
MQVFTKRGQDHRIAGYPDWIASPLHARGVTTREEADRFLNPDFDQLSDPLALHDMAKAVEIIRALGRRKARAVIYGDYDVDGLCASVIAREALEAVGLKAIVYIPDRHLEGYGLNADAIRQLAPQAELLLTVDCGITAVDEVALAKTLGMSVIITDHHKPAEALPEADALINPLLGGYPFPSLCGAATAWKLSLSLKGPAFARGQLDLAALATVADMVPLLGENRIIASLGMAAMASTRREGLRALMAAMGLQPGESLSSDKLSFGLAPRLNAGGRLTTAQDALRLLMSEHPEEARELALRLNDLNSQRQTQERQVLAEAEEMLAGADLLHVCSIVLSREGWNSGVVGLVAGRLAEKYAYPAVVLSADGERCTGSGRSAGGIDLHGALKACADLFLRFGGHQQAAGLTMPTANLPAFRARFEEAIRDQLAGRELQAQVPYDTGIDLSQVTLEAVQALDRLAPFGMGNPSPAFLLEEVTVASSRAVGADGRHLKLSLRQDREMRDGIAFGMGDRQAGLPPTLDAVVRLSLNTYQGRVTPQCQVTALKAGKEAFLPDENAEAETILQEMQAMASNASYAAGNAAEAEPVQGMSGTLLICRSIATARLMHSLYPGFETVTGPHSDRRGGNAILYRTPLGAVRAPCDRLLFCDGLLCPQEAGYAGSLFPGARLLASPRSASLDQLLAGLRLDREEMREAYRHLRETGDGSSLSWPPSKARAACLVLAELGLVQMSGWRAQLLPMQKIDLERSAIYRWLS